MKYLETESLNSLNSALEAYDLGDSVVRGSLSAWSCKLAGVDKKLSASIEHEVVTSIASSPASLSTSPIGPLTDAGSRKTLIYLILTLNHMYPDYDFSNLRAHHFTKEDGFASTRAAVETSLLEPARLWAGVGGGAMGSSAHALETLWARLEEVIQPAECDVYSYKGDAEGDPFSVAGSLWSFNFFLYNRKLKRILFFTASAISKRGGGEEDGMGGGDDDDDEARAAGAGGFFALEDDDMDL